MAVASEYDRKVVFRTQHLTTTRTLTTFLKVWNFPCKFVSIAEGLFFTYCWICCVVIASEFYHNYFDNVFMFLVSQLFSTYIEKQTTLRVLRV